MLVPMATATRRGTTEVDGAAQDESAECPRCLGENLDWLLGQAHFALGSEINASL